jgi:hypothetical protein
MRTLHFSKLSWRWLSRGTQRNLGIFTGQAFCFAEVARRLWFWLWNFLLENCLITFFLLNSVIKGTKLQ